MMKYLSFFLGVIVLYMAIRALGAKFILERENPQFVADAEPAKPVETVVVTVPVPPAQPETQNFDVESTFSSLNSFVHKNNDLVNFDITSSDKDLLLPLSALDVQIRSPEHDVVVAAIKDPKASKWSYFIDCLRATIFVPNEDSAAVWCQWIVDQKQYCKKKRDRRNNAIKLPPGYAPPKPPEEKKEEKPVLPPAPEKSKNEEKKEEKKEEKPVPPDEPKEKEVQWYRYGPPSLFGGGPVDAITYDPKNDAHEDHLTILVVRIIHPATFSWDGKWETTKSLRIPLVGVEFIPRADDAKELAAKFAEIPKPESWQHELHDYHRVQIACPIEALPLWRLWLERVKKEHAEYVAAERKKVEEAAPKPRMILPPPVPETTPVKSSEN